MWMIDNSVSLQEYTQAADFDDTEQYKSSKISSFCISS